MDFDTELGRTFSGSALHAKLRPSIVLITKYWIKWKPLIEEAQAGCSSHRNWNLAKVQAAEVMLGIHLDRLCKTMKCQSFVTNWIEWQLPYALGEIATLNAHYIYRASGSIVHLAQRLASSRHLLVPPIKASHSWIGFQECLVLSQAKVVRRKADSYRVLVKHYCTAKCHAEDTYHRA